jgi:predicted short-subunit dehydrogenase-like oxidoreductase (DUF2520 family)
MTADDRTGMVFEVVKNSDETYHVAPKHVSQHILCSMTCVA